MIAIEGQQIKWYSGLTLAKVVAALPHGHLYAVVRMNGRLISKPDFAGTIVPDKAVIEPLPLVAGG